MRERAHIELKRRAPGADWRPPWSENVPKRRSLKSAEYVQKDMYVSGSSAITCTVTGSASVSSSGVSASPPTSASNAPHGESEIGLA